jgi:hypothetical protein
MDQKDLRRHAGLCRQAAVEQALLMAIQSPDMGSGADENGAGYKVCLLSPPHPPLAPAPPPLLVPDFHAFAHVL